MLNTKVQRRIIFEAIKIFLPAFSVPQKNSDFDPLYVQIYSSRGESLNILI
jgi:hypothetical protein